MRTIDTNILVRLITRDNPLQANFAEALIEQGAWVSILALAELVWVLSTAYDRNPVELTFAIEMLLTHKSLTLQEPDTVLRALDLFRNKPSLGFSECLMLQLTRKAGNLPLGTFDRDLAKVEGTQRL